MIRSIIHFGFPPSRDYVRPASAATGVNADLRHNRLEPSVTLQLISKSEHEAEKERGGSYRQMLTHFLLLTLLMAAMLVPLAHSKGNGRSSRLEVACVGDSITFGSGASNRNTTAYPAVLQRLLGGESA